MNYARKRIFNRVVALLLSVLMVSSIVPMDVFAIETKKSAVSINLDEEPFIANEEKEFSVTTTTNGDEGTLVRGYFEFTDLPDGSTVELKYYEPQDGKWYPLTGAFGPETGFPMTDGATSTFSAKFSTPGNYNVTVSIKTVDGGSELCSTTKTVVVDRKASVLSTNVGEKTFVSGEATEFTFSTTPNDDAGKLVRGYFEFTNLPEGTTAKLEYYEPQDGNWYELTGPFGPETGFPMKEGGSKFRATFNKPGTYEVAVSMKTVADDMVLCSTTANVVVNKKASIVSSDIDEKEFVAGEAMEFTFSTTANDDKDAMVRGYFEFSDPSAIEKLEYYEPKDQNWYELTGAFGPETGFPMITGTSKFRATFNKAGAYEVTVSMKTVADQTVLCSIKKNVTVIQKVTVGVIKNVGGTVTLNGTNSDELSSGLRVKVGTNVAVNVQAESGYRIDSIKIAGETVANVSGESKYTVDRVVDKDLQIEVAFVKVWTVTASKNTGGSVSLNDIDSANLENGMIVNTGSKVSVKVKADDGYQISALNLGGIFIADACGQTEFTVANMIVGRDVNVEVTFVKVWTVTVSCDENGKVYIDDPQKAAGDVTATIVEGTKVVVAAEPKNGYRVSEVRVTEGEVQKTPELFTANNQKYKKDIEKLEDDYKIEITFAPNIYNIETAVNKKEYGTVDTTLSKVEHGSDTVIKVQPADGYSVTDIKIKGESKENYTNITGNIDKYIADFAASTDCSGVITFTVKGITEHQKIDVTFTKTVESDAKFEDLFDDESAVRINEHTYVYKKDGENATTVEFKTPDDLENLKYVGIVLYDKAGDEISYGTIAGDSRTTFLNVSKPENTEVVEIGKIELLYQAKAANEMTIMRHRVSTLENPITLVFDHTLEQENITLIPEAANVNGIYGLEYIDGIEVNVKVEDLSFDKDHYPNAYSGIKKISYKVVKDGNEVTQEGSLYERKADDGILQTWNSAAETEDDYLPIIVNPEKNNSCDVKVIVTVVDMAGNLAEQEVELDIDITKPVVAISFDENDFKYAQDDRGYYNGQRIATVAIEERHFDEDEKETTLSIIENAIKAWNPDPTNPEEKIYIVGDELKALYEFTDWEQDPKTGFYSTKITFMGDANYEWDPSCTDKAGNTAVKNEFLVQMDINTPYAFTVDTTAPTGCITAIAKQLIDGEWGDENNWAEMPEQFSKTWYTLHSKWNEENQIFVEGAELTFNFWARDQIDISTASKDVTSPAALNKIQYYKQIVQYQDEESQIPIPTALTTAELDALKEEEWKSISDWKPVTTDEQFVVYIRITDIATNYCYISTDGLIVDTKDPVESIAPEIKIEDNNDMSLQQSVYNEDVTITIKVNDPIEKNTYSGLKTVYCEVLCDGEVPRDANGNLKEKAIAKTLATFDALERTWKDTITIDKTLYNSNDVKVIVYAQDNALNVSSKSIDLKIDSTLPQINISYDNNNVDSGCYFAAPRTATISIQERNFDAKDVYMVLNGQEVVLEWQPDTDETDPKKWKDTRTHRAVIAYVNDGSYSFAIGSKGVNENGQVFVDFFKDMAGNTCSQTVNKEEISAVNYGVSGAFFIIDKTCPQVSVTYDNNNSMNGNYYKDVRTATITIIEPNLSPNADIGRVQVTMTATDDGNVIANPTVSSWATNGATHTATIAYVAEGYYTFDIVVRDKAGNYANDLPAQSFYIDKTAPSLEIAGVENNSANAGNVIPVITYSDTNWDPAQVNITLTGANRGSVALDGAYTDIHNGRVFTFRNFAKVQGVDDIYTLTATLTDKAGNTTTETLNFSVNRFGSTYAVSDATKALNGTYVQEPIDVVVTETNADALENIKITLFKNNQTLELVEGEDYKITLKGGNGQWHQYTYTVFAKTFAEDGVYRLAFHSEDAAGNIAENTLDTKEMEIGFGVDATKPDIVVANIADGVTYALENITVNMSINDNLLLKSIKVYLDNVEVKKWSAEEITAVYAENGEFTFDIPGDSKSAHEVRIVSVDAAGNEAVETISNFYVTTDILVRYVNNKPLFYGSISGTCLLAALTIFLIVFVRKRKEEQE